MGLLIRNRAQYSAGEVYAYSSRGRMFGCVILFRQQDYYLIALSEELAKPAKTLRVEDVLAAELYTLAWFSDLEMLLPRRLRPVGTVPLAVDYSDRAGLRIDEHGVRLKNIGQRATWDHSFRSFALRDTAVKDVLSTALVPKTR